MEDRPKFIVDVMLGKLARWLRTLGFDVEYQNSVDADALLLRATREGRVILTRDARLVKRRASAGGALFIRSDGFVGQLKEVLGRYQIDKDLILSRCLRCNAGLENVERASVEGAVPAYVFDTQTQFSRCPSCRRIYWPGTHRQKMLETLSGIIEGLE